jgi:hypothetical protein
VSTDPSATANPPAIRVHLSDSERFALLKAWYGRQTGKPVEGWKLFVLVFFIPFMLLQLAFNLTLNLSMWSHVSLWRVLPVEIALLALTVAVTVFAILVARGSVTFPAIARDVTIAPAKDGLLLESSNGRELVPWSRIRAVWDVGGAVMIQLGLTKLIGVPKQCDPDGMLWSLLDSRLTAKRMLVRHQHAIIYNTARNRTV